MRISSGFIAPLMALFIVLLLGWGLANVWRIMRSTSEWPMPVGGPKVVVAFLFGALLMMGLPVLADHVSEPTNPISGIRLSIFQYTNPTPTFQQVRNDGGIITYAAGCDGTQVVDFDNLRVETDVQSLAIARTGNPSEHFKEDIRLDVVFNFGTPQETFRYEWASQWKHTNIPPHSAPRGSSDQGWESSQNNQRLDAYAPGTVLRFVHQLRGNESGVDLTESCTFIVG